MTDRPPLRKAAAGAIIAVFAVLVLAADQFTKYLALQNLPYETPVPVLGDFLIFYLVRNPGAAFSLGEGVTWIFTIALAAVSVLIVWLAATRIRSRLWAVALGLLLGGVLGNLSDRLFREPGFAVGHVVDFINTPWMMPAIYNVADIFIVSMMIGVALLVLIGLRFDGTRDQKHPEDAESDSAAGADAAAEPRSAAEAGAAADAAAAPVPAAESVEADKTAPADDVPGAAAKD